MAAKPNETLNFAPADASVVPVPSGKQAVGFVAGEKPPARYLNWLFRTLSRLYNYVLDGNFEGNHTINGTLATTGSFTTDGDAVIDGNATVGGTLGVAGNVTTDLVMASGKKVKGIVRTRVIPIVGPTVENSPSAGRYPVISGNGSGANRLYAEIPMEAGRTITAVRVELTDSSVGPSTAHFTINSTTAGGGISAALATSNTSTGSGLYQVIQATALTVLAASATTYMVIVTGVSGVANMTVHRLSVDDVQL